jgi:hypothetical protein
MFKALVQFGAGEAALFAAAFYGVSIMSGAILVLFAYIAIEAVWSEYKIADKVVGGLENALE